MPHRHLRYLIRYSKAGAQRRRFLLHAYFLGHEFDKFYENLKVIGWKVFEFINFCYVAIH